MPTRTADREKSDDPAANCVTSGGSDHGSGTATSDEPNAHSPQSYSDTR